LPHNNIVDLLLFLFYILMKNEPSDIIFFGE